MAQTSGWWTTSGTPSGHQVASYTQAIASTLAEIISACSGKEGVAPSYLNELAGSVPGLNTARIATGGGIVDGKWYKSDANVDVTIPSAVGGGNTRIDRIVLRASWSAFTVTITRIAGTDAASPTPPAITQTPGTTYDILLYQALVDTSGNVTLTDERTWALVAVDDSTIQNNAGTLRVKDLGISTAKIANNAVDNTKIRDSAGRSVIGKATTGTGDPADITAAASTVLGRDGSNDLGFGQLVGNQIAAGTIGEGKLDAALAAKLVTNGDSHDHNGGDGAQIPTGGIAALAVTGAKIDADAVDDTKVGNRVPQFYRRQGGDATDWSVPGTTTRTPTTVRMQAGVIAITIANGSSSGNATVTFPQAFSAPPIVTFAIGPDTSIGQPNSNPQDVAIYATLISATQVRIDLRRSGTTTQLTWNVHWMAVGAE